MVNRKLRKTLFFILLTAGIFMSACSFVDSISGAAEENNVEITSLTFGKNAMSLKVGNIDYIPINIKPSNEQKNVRLGWNYDSSIIECDTSSVWGVTVKGLKEGQTSLRCSYGGYDANCVITVAGYAENYEQTTEPYIYSNTSIIQTTPGVTERVYVSLYGGTAADIDGYTWTCDNPSVCGIQPTGQYCLITAKDTGYARIKITHQKSQYPYYMGIYVFGDAMNVPYITTGSNIVTMNQGDTSQNISVSLVNGKETSLDSAFRWEILNDSASSPVTVEANGSNAVITPVRGGSCTVRVTHPDAAYPLEILCRVLTIVKNVYIEPNNTVFTLTGDSTELITCNLRNINVGEYDANAYEYTLDDYSVAEIVSKVGNQVMVKGKANGSCKLTITHEKAAYAREVLLIVNGQLTDAVDASCYITTSQNYIRTKEGADGIYLDISLKGGEDGDESKFTWTIQSNAADGSSARVIDMDTAHGNVNHAARMAMQTYAYGRAFIEPLAEGTAVITITHPKVVYPTEVLVKVLNRNAVLEEPLYFSGSGLLKILNGESAQYTATLSGKNKTPSDDYNIRWQASDSRVRITPSGNTATVFAPSMGTGETVSNMTVSHNKADADKKVVIMTADDQETLDNMKALYTDKSYYNINVGDKTYLITNAVGFDSADSEGNYIPYDFSSARWTVANPQVASVQRGDFPLIGIVEGLKSGTTKVTVSVDGYSCEYDVTVYPKGSAVLEPEVYFTTSKNVITLSGKGKTTNANITAINLPTSECSSIAWESSDTNVATVIGNGTSATITAWTEGESVISVSHPKSQNTLKIYVRVGSEYVVPDAEPIVYISSQEVITMLRDDSPQRLDAVLVNYTGTDTSGFTFSIDNETVATISSQSKNGIAYVKPVGSGQAEITISHPKTEITKKVLVVVGNSAEELAGLTYLTTSTNVVTVGEGNTKNVSVAVKNSDEVVLDGYTWTSSNPAVVDVTATGANAVFTGNSIGTAVVTVTNKKCKYSLQIIAQCVDPIAAAQCPYIQLTSSVITVNTGTQYTNVTADLVGGKESDFANFSWTSSDPSICTVYGQNEIGKVRALKAGTAYITVSHPKAIYPAQLLVVCDEIKESECYISVPANIMNMKPTDSMQSVTANLINGTVNDKYSFSWSMDVFDVVDLVYSANVCTITPKQQGQCTITISHPKAAYPQQIVVTVQEYSDFAFPSTNMTMTQGDVRFLTMQIPNTKVSTYVEYSVANSAICSITGTKSTAQITAVGPGTTTVKAKLIASSTGVVQAEDEMMVYVKERPVNAVYISSNSTIYTINKDKSMSLSAVLSGQGVTNDDLYNLKWTTHDTDVIKITGISSDGTIKGQSIYVTGVNPGEALITCSHEKAQSDLQFYVVVPGNAEKTITLNKTYLTIMKGSSGADLKATIDNSESSNDYYDIDWSVHSAGQDEVCRIMGNGRTVTIYPINVGEAEVIAQLPNSQKVAKCTIKVEAGRSFAFESTGTTVTPFRTKKMKYTVSPPDAEITWNLNQPDDYFSYRDLGHDEKGVGYVEVEGIKPGTGNLTGLTDGGAKGGLNVKVSWDYKFTLNTTAISTTPDETSTILYNVYPPDLEVKLTSTGVDTDFTYGINNDPVNGTGTITINPLRETMGDIEIRIVATNPNSNNEQVGMKSVLARFQYNKLTPVIRKVPLTTGLDYYSYYDDYLDTIYLTDGQTLRFRLSFEERNATINRISVSFPGDRTKINVKDEGGGMYEISSLVDVVEYGYYLEKLVVPYYNNEEYPVFDIETGEPNSDLAWYASETHSDMVGGYHFDTTIWLASKSHSTITKIKQQSAYNHSGTLQTMTHYGLLEYYNMGPYGRAYGARIDEDTSIGAWSVKEYDLSKLTKRQRLISEYNFNHNAWFFFPDGRVDWDEGIFEATYDSTCNLGYPWANCGMSPNGRGIIERHVTAEYGASKDTTPLSETSLGSMVIEVETPSGAKQMKIPIRLITRACPADYHDED